MKLPAGYSVSFAESNLVPSPRYQVPSMTVDQFGLRVSMREDTNTGGYLRSIGPEATFAGVTEQLRSLSAVVVVRRRKPPYFVRS